MRKSFRPPTEQVARLRFLRWLIAGHAGKLEDYAERRYVEVVSSWRQPFITGKAVDWMLLQPEHVRLAGARLRARYDDAIKWER